MRGVHTEAAHPVRRKWETAHVTEKRCLVIRILAWSALDGQSVASPLLCLWCRDGGTQDRPTGLVLTVK